MCNKNINSKGDDNKEKLNQIRQRSSQCYTQISCFGIHPIDKANNLIINNITIDVGIMTITNAIPYYQNLHSKIICTI